ncbi:MAG TPA: permease-like cell division protein FtsX [Gemmatimonadaceae bacterium]|jgi:cell division transport system permease protein|nr:permease-like cell division protein FtsX [Gemmatimonadaceae bacterium]
MRSAQEALTASRRAPLLSALGVLTIAFSLFAFGLFGLVAINIRRALEQVSERVEVRAFLSDSADIEQVAAAMKDIGEFPEVLRVDYVSQENALERARKEMGEFADVFEAGVLPASIEVHLRPGMRSPTIVKSVADRIKTYHFIDDVRYGEEWVEKLYRLRNIATVAGIALGVAFAAVAVIIIGATIRMMVLARAKEISIMRLVGATDMFIRLPFLIDGLVKGVLGGLVALLLVWITNRVVNQYFIETIFFNRELIFLGIVGGAAMGMFGSLVSVGRHLRRV